MKEFDETSAMFERSQNAARKEFSQEHIREGPLWWYTFHHFTFHVHNHEECVCVCEAFCPQSDSLIRWALKYFIGRVLSYRKLIIRIWFDFFTTNLRLEVDLILGRGIWVWQGILRYTIKVDLEGCLQLADVDAFAERYLCPGKGG